MNNRLLLLDTHVLVWFLGGERRLGREVLSLLDMAREEENLTVSAISFWEVALLVKGGRLHLDIPVDAWQGQVLEDSIQEIPVWGHVGILAAELVDFHRDPADRIIVATALSSGAVLVTADTKILDWKGRLDRHDARN